MVVWKVENGQFKAEKWSGHLIQTDTWLDKLLLFFHNQLQHCRGGAKRVKKEDKATAGYRLSNSQWSPGGHLEPQTIFTPDYRVSNQPLTHTTIHFLKPTQTKTRLSCSLTATRRVQPFFHTKCSQQYFHANKMFTRERLHSTNHWIWFFSVHFYARMATNQDLHTESVKACQSGCASPGGGEITEERHIWCSRLPK